MDNNTQNQAPASPPPAPRGFMTQGVMWASAFVLAGLTMMQAGRFGAAPARGNDIVSSVGGMTALVFESQNEDLLAAIDGRQETLFVYRVVNKNSVEMAATYNLAQVFSDARSRTSGGGRVR